MTLFGLIAVILYLLYKRSTEIVVVRSSRTSSKPDFAKIVNAVQEAARQAAEQPADESRRHGARLLGDARQAAVRALVKNDQFLEAIKLYGKLYNVDPYAAKKAVDKIMLEL